MKKMLIVFGLTMICSLSPAQRGQERPARHKEVPVTIWSGEKLNNFFKFYSTGEGLGGFHEIIFKEDQMWPEVKGGITKFRWTQKGNGSAKFDRDVYPFGRSVSWITKGDTLTATGANKRKFKFTVEANTEIILTAD